MERGPRSPEGGEQHETPETPAEPIYEQLTDEQRIQGGIADALIEGRVIDDATAWRIAGRLHTGPDSALYAWPHPAPCPTGWNAKSASPPRTCHQNSTAGTTPCSTTPKPEARTADHAKAGRA